MNPIRVTHEVNESIAVCWHLPGLPWHTPFVHVLTYRCTPGLRPYVHPLWAPGGGPCLTQDRPTDHPWQHGIFVGLHGVNGVDFWVEHRAKPEVRGEVRCVAIADLRADEWTSGRRAAGRVVRCFRPLRWRTGLDGGGSPGGRVEWGGRARSPVQCHLPHPLAGRSPRPGQSFSFSAGRLASRAGRGPGLPL